MNGFCALEPRGAFSVLLAAWPPTQRRDRRPDFLAPWLRHEAIISAARAVFAIGGELLVAGEPDVAPLLAAVALDYVPLREMEAPEPGRAPLIIAESGGWDPQLRALLAPYVLRGAVSYLDESGEALQLTEVDSRGSQDEHRRHPVTPWMLERFRVSGAIFISPRDEARREIEMVREHGIQVAVLAETVPYPDDAERWRDFDPMPGLVGEVPLNRWTEVAEELPWLEEGAGLREPAFAREPRPPQQVMPYAFALQSLVARWAG